MEAALALLSDPTRRIPAGATTSLPNKPGIYAFWPADEHIADYLYLVGEKALGAPLYVGLARQSLRARTQEHLDPLYVGRTEFHGALGWWLSEIAETVPWHPHYRLLQDDFGRGRLSSAYAESALCAFMRAGLTISVAECGSEAEARKLEHPLIAKTHPIFNAGTRALHLTEDADALGGRYGQPVRHRFYVRTLLRPWFLKHIDILATAGADDLFAVRQENNVPVGPPRRMTSNGKLRDNEAVVAGTPPTLAREGLIDECPEWWYSPAHRALYGEPPPWPAIVANLTDTEASRLFLEETTLASLDERFPDRIFIEFFEEGPLVSIGGDVTDAQLLEAGPALAREIKNLKGQQSN